MLLHSLVPLTKSSTLIPGCHPSSQATQSQCTLRLSTRHPPPLSAAECVTSAARSPPRKDALHLARCDTVVHTRGHGGAQDGPCAAGSPGHTRNTDWWNAPRDGRRAGRKLTEIRSLVSGKGEADTTANSVGSSPQLRAARVASVSHREQLRLSPGWSTGHCSPSPNIHSSLLRRNPGSLSSASSSPSLTSPASSSSCSPTASPSSPRGGLRDKTSSPVSSLFRTGSALRGGSFSLSAASSSGSGFKLHPPGLGEGAVLDVWRIRPTLEHGFTSRFLAESNDQASSLEAHSSGTQSLGSSDTEQSESEEEGHGMSSDAESSWKQRRETKFRVTGVPGDGRCLFMSVVYGLCHVSGNPLPSSYMMRCQWADKLRQLVADEFVKRREETEWFLEGRFEDYISNIRKPHVWGGEPELLMLSHVLKYPISVFIVDPSEGVMDEGIIPIAEYGQEYTFSPDGYLPCERDDEDTSAPRAPICVLYNGSSHYDSVQLLPLEEELGIA